MLATNPLEALVGVESGCRAHPIRARLIAQVVEAYFASIERCPSVTTVATTSSPPGTTSVILLSRSGLTI